LVSGSIKLNPIAEGIVNVVPVAARDRLVFGFR
jgi:hypothetical protein